MCSLLLLLFAFFQVRSLELVSVLLACCKARILDNHRRTWIRGSVVRVVGLMVAMHADTNDVRIIRDLFVI